MQFRSLGKTGIRVSRLAYGAGPIAGLMTSDGDKSQLAVVQHALDVGINWFDTAASYGTGKSEKSLGTALRKLSAGSEVHVATKVRLMPDELDDISGNVRASVTGSLKRLGMSQVTLLQIHNAITARRGDEPTSITPADVLEPGGFLEIFQQLRSEGLIKHLGLTAVGQAVPLNEVVSTGEFDTIQVPYNLMNPSAGQEVSQDFEEANYGNVIAECARQNMGVLAIRVYAAGALIGLPPQPYTYKTKFFSLDLYKRDQVRAARLKKLLGSRIDLNEAAVRFVISHPDVTSAIIGLGEPMHINEALRCIEAGPLPPDLVEELRGLEYHLLSGQDVG